MIASVISDTSITFIARGRPWQLASDHPSFHRVKAMLASESTTEDEVIYLADVRVAINEATEGKAVLSEDGLFLDGEKLSHAWEEMAVATPEHIHVLIVSPGDQVRVEGDEDAPDGVYTVGDTDNSDTQKRVYVESEDDYFGFVSNSSIKEIIRG
jgi:hypothetical protein